VWAFYESNYEAEKRRKEQEINMKRLEILDAQLEYYQSLIEEKPDFVKIADEVLKEATQ